MHRMLYRRALAVLTLAAVALSCLTVPAPAMAIDDVAGSTLVTLPVPSGQKDYASSDGGIVVWQTEPTIWGYDTSTKRLFHVPAVPGWRFETPKISGTTVVFGAQNVNDSRIDVWGYDLSTETTFVVCDDPGEQDFRALDGDIAVWTTWDDNYTQHVEAKNLRSGERFAVPYDRGSQRTPDVAGDWIVYADHSGYHGDNIKAYNIATKASKTLCSWTGDQYYPRISNTGFVVWQNVTDPAHPDATMDLYGCKVTDGVIRKIAGGYGAQHSPTIGGNIIVYMDSAKPGGYGLVGYDLLSNTRFGISKSIAWFYYIAGIENGTIARLYTNYDVHPYNTKVQLFYPTALDIISGSDAGTESVANGDEGLQPEAPLLSPSAFAPASRIETVVVASSASWTSSTLASELAAKRYPVLLVNSSVVATAALEKLASYAPAHVVIAGGPTSFSRSALGQLGSVVGTSAISFLQGADTTARSASLATLLAARDGFPGTMIVCAASSSAMTAIPASVSKGVPIVLVGSKGLTSGQVAALKAAGARRFAVVGTGVPSGTLSRLRSAVGSTNVRVILGTSVAATSVSFAAWEVATLHMRWNDLAIASASNWTHTPMAALSRGRADSVLLLTSPIGLSSATKSALVAHHSAIRHASFVGRTSVISNTVRRQVRLAIK